MTIFFVLFLVFLIFVIFAALIFVFLRMRDSLFIKIPFVSTRKRAINIIVKALALSKNSVLYEPGCGNANILKTAIKNTPGARGVGVEKGYVPFIFSYFNTRKLPISIYYKDILSTDFSQATHIYCYLYGDMMNKLSLKILNECVPGTRIVSCDFILSNVPLIETIYLDFDGDKLSRALYIYEVK